MQKILVATTAVVMGLLSASQEASRAANPPILALLLPDDNSFLEDTGGTVVVRIFHASGTGASGAKFSVRASVGFAGVLLSEEYPFGSTFWLGNVTDGLILVLPPGFCGGVNTHYDIVTMTFQLYGTSAPCSYLEVIAHPDEVTPLVWRCDATLVEPRVHRLWVNYDHYNGCPPPVATEQTTWGRVKALYRN